ncbi:MAG: Rrf2 family transcriptional regulator [Acidobacteriia bacterium]|nr:Rrf2 family transcriptional regulator [Terriglobia bacterium]
MLTSLFSRPCSYALRAVTYLAAQPQGKLTGKKEVAQRESIPSAFLSKVLLSLCHNHVLRSRKGLRGGYELAVPAEQISLLTVVRAVSGEPFQDCLLEERQCSSTHPCELHDSWAVVRGQLLEYFETLTAADLVRLRRHEDSGSDLGSASGVAQTVRPTERGE